MYVTAAPRGPLSGLVASIWLYEGEEPGHARDLRLPTGAVDLAFVQDAATGVADH